MSLSIINKKLRIKSKIICKYFISGKCIKGKNCPYLHIQIDQPKDITEIECPMYSIGYCKNGPVCHFAHIKKDFFPIKENEKIIKIKEKEDIKEKIKPKKNEIKIKNKIIEEEDDTSSTPLAEDFISDSESGTEKLNLEDRKNKNKIIINKDEKSKTNNKLSNIQNNKEIKEKYKYFHEIPIWYLEHYYDKPISMIYADLESQNLPEVIDLQKKYGLYNEDNTSQLMQSIIRKNNLNMNTLNLNFNNFNMNFDLNNNISNFSNNNNIDYDLNYNYIQDNYQRDIDDIEFIINKDINIFYYLIKLKKFKEVEKAFNSNIIELPERLYNKYKDINLFFNDLTIIIIIYNYENNDFEGFAQLEYPILDDENENEEIKEKINLYKIDWLWKTKLEYSEVRHLMNKADHDHFLNESKNGCPLHKDLGNYLCRLMIKRLTKKEEIELMNEKEIFKNQMKYSQYLKNLKNYENELEYEDENYNNNIYDYSFESSYYYEDEYDDDYYDNIKGNNSYMKNKKYKDNFTNNYNYKFNYIDYPSSNDKNNESILEKINYKKYNKRKSKHYRRNSISKSLSRNRNKKRRRSKSYYSHSEHEKKSYYRKKNIKNYSGEKNKKYREKVKKIYSKVNQEYISSLKIK